MRLRGRTRKTQFDVGDVFTIPLDEGRVALGQIAARYGKSGGHFYFAAWAAARDGSEGLDLATAVSSPPDFLVLSLDALLYNEHWQVLGRVPVNGSMPWPAYKLGTIHDQLVVDYTGEKERVATEGEGQALRYRTVDAPIALENAVKAVNGLAVWNERFDRFRPPPEHLTTSALFD